MSPTCFDVIPFNNVDNSLLQDNAILLRLESLKKIHVFQDLSDAFKCRQDIYPFLT